VKYRFLFICFLISVQIFAQNKEADYSTSINQRVLNEVTVRGNRQQAVTMSTTLNITNVSNRLLRENLSGSLMQTLDHVPGVTAMSIGSGLSKPAIRGLGFNRLVVAENGIKHEGQQWGEDHGLEVNQFAVENVDIIKGPASLIYGSDAIGGVINLRNNLVPVDRVEGKINLFTRSNNESLGLAVSINGRDGRFFYKTNLTLIDYADYKVPTDSIRYNSYTFRLNNGRLRNTAGEEYGGNVTLGWLSNNLKTSFDFSNLYSRSGFFANARGLGIMLSDIDFDRSSRDVDLPYQSVNHFKLANTTSLNLEDIRLEGRFAYQNNYRKEFAERISHGYMPIPPDNLERQFDKNTYSAAIDGVVTINSHELTVGVSAEHQNNRRAGWGFVIPDFRQTSYGAFAYDCFNLSDNLIISTGIRLEHTNTEIDSYSDWFKTPVGNGDSVFKQRSSGINRSFNSIAGSVGMIYTSGLWLFKANAGKSFRAPIAKELGADGMNYHIFRYERGEAKLSPEESYQFDAVMTWNGERMKISVEPYINYFPNYIYLNPTSEYYEGLQVYHYTQSRVLRYGVEGEIKYHFNGGIDVSLSGEYLYAEQLSGAKKGYGLPFSPPWSTVLNVRYSPQIKWAGQNTFISADYKITGKQERIVPPEKITKGYQVLNLTIGSDFKWNNNTIYANMQMQNLLGQIYYDHTSYYRLIEIPEPGRNLSILLGLRF